MFKMNEWRISHMTIFSFRTYRYSISYTAWVMKNWPREMSPRTQTLNTRWLLVVRGLWDVSCEQSAIRASKQEVGSITGLGTDRCIHIRDDRKHLPLRKSAKLWESKRWQIWGDEWHRKCVVSQVAFVALRKHVLALNCLNCYSE